MSLPHNHTLHAYVPYDKMPLRSFSFLLLLFFFVSLLSSAAASPNNDLLHTSCVHASYPSLCLRTLSTYSGAGNTPHDLAVAAVKVSIARASKATDYLSALTAGTKKARAAVSDCVEQMSDSMDQLSKSLGELKHLRSGESFRWQMSNAETWVSAALTNENTCLDGFQDLGIEVKGDFKRKISNVAKVTSNALYLINRLDESRGRGKRH